MREKNIFEKYSETLESEGLYLNGKRLLFYLNNYVFEDIRLKGKSLIDIGSGKGIHSFFAGFGGAKRVVCIERNFGTTMKLWASLSA